MNSQRHIIYIDGAIQKRLLLALVALEIVLVAGGVGALYWLLGDAVDANFYSAHLADKLPMYPPPETALVVVGGLVAFNFGALWLVGWMWARHLNSILQPLSEEVGKGGMLDFSPDFPEVPSTAAPHKVVALARAWRKAERQRLRTLRTAISRLQDSGDTPTLETEERARVALEDIRKLLP